LIHFYKREQTSENIRDKNREPEGDATCHETKGDHG